MDVLIIYLLIINAVGLALMLIDKRKAIKNAWRIPEKVLLGTALLGGSLGTLFGMYAVRHKTRKPAFFVGIPVMLILQIALIGIWIIKSDTFL